MKYLKLSIFTLALLAAPAWAHTDEYLDTVAAPHGGQLRMAGAHHFELVVKAGEVSVYLTDHAGTRISSKGSKGSVTILAKGAKTVIPLAPAGENMMKGNGKFDLSPDMKVVVSVDLPVGGMQQARFEPLKKEGMKHDG